MPDEPIGSLQDRPDQSPTGEVPEPAERSRATLDAQSPRITPEVPRITPEAPRITTSIRNRVDDWLEGESVDSLDAAKESTLVEDSLDDAASVSSAAVASAASSASTAGVDDDAAPIMGELQLGFVQLHDRAAADGWSPRQIGSSQSAQLKQVVLTLQKAQPDHWVLLVRRIVQQLQHGGLLQPEVSESLRPWLERQWEMENGQAAARAAAVTPSRLNGATRAPPLERAAPDAAELNLGADLGLDDLSSMSAMLEQMESEQRRFEAMVAAGARNGSSASHVGDETRVELAELAELTSSLAELQSDLMRSAASSSQPAPVPVSATFNGLLATVLGGFRSVSGALGSLLLDELPVEEAQRVVELATPVAAATDRRWRVDEPLEQLGTWYALGSDSGATAAKDASAASAEPSHQVAPEPSARAPRVEPATAQPGHARPSLVAATTSSSPPKYAPPSPASPSLDEQLTAQHPRLNSMCDEAERSVSPKIARAANAAAEQVVRGGLGTDDDDDAARGGANELALRPAAAATPTATTPATAAVPKASAKNIEVAFRRIDKSRDGPLSRAELIEACRQDAAVRALLGLPCGLPAAIRQEDGSREQFERVLQQLDADASGSVSLDAFVRFFSGGSANGSSGGNGSGGGGGGGGSRCKSSPSAEPPRAAAATVPAAAAAAGSDAKRHEARIAELEKQIREMRDNPASSGCEAIGAPWRPLCQPPSPSSRSSPSGPPPPRHQPTPPQLQFLQLQQLQQLQQAGKGMMGPGSPYGFGGRGKGFGPSPMATYGSRPGKGRMQMMHQMSGGQTSMGSPQSPGTPPMAPPVPLGPGMGPGGPSGKGMTPGSPSGPRAIAPRCRRC